MTLGNLTILCDMDDVLLDLIPQWVEKLNEVCDAINMPAHITERDITDWDITKFFPMLTKEQIFSVTKRDGFWESVQPTYHGQYFIKQMLTMGHTVRIVTASCCETLPCKMKRFLRLYRGLSWQDVIVTSYKQCIKGDVLVDDAFHNLVGGEYDKILLNKPHNRNFDAESHGVRRVENLIEAFHIIQRKSR